MAGGGWEPIDPPDPGEEGQDTTASGDTRPSAPGPLTPPPAPPPSPPPPPRATHPLLQVPWWRLAGGALPVIVGLLLLLGVFAESRVDQGPPRAAPTISEPLPLPPAEAVRQARRRARAAFTDAGARLRDEGSFAYSGEVEIAATSLLRPATQLAGRVTVQGQVSLPRRTREIAVDESGRAFETVLVGPGVWERDAVAAAALPVVPLELTARRERGELGAALVPEWLEMAEDQGSMGEAPGGGHRFQAVVRYPDGPDDMVITLDVDDDGVPTHVRLASASTSLVIDLDITAVGEPVDIATPDGGPVGVAPLVTADEVAAAGLTAPVQLTEVPPDWILAGVRLEPDTPRPGCATLQLDYRPIDGEPSDGEWLVLDMQAQPCAPTAASGDAPLDAGAYHGQLRSITARRSMGRVSDGTTSIAIDTSLPPDQIRHVLETLRPYDPTLQPTPSDALATP